MENRVRFIRLASFVLIIGTCGVKSQYVGGLEGRRAPCALEGLPVKVDHIDKAKCFACICKNGFVECSSGAQCPPYDGCHMLLERTKNNCCRTCRGCQYNNNYHSSHTEWTDPENPCKILRCEAGVVTISDMQCFTPCSNPLPPEPGKCCSTCPDCRINGQEATDDRDVIPDDPCLKCRCNKGRMTCSKKACPVLQCNTKNQRWPPGECCPVCEGTRSVMHVPKSCRLQETFSREGYRLNLDKCTNCTCLDETSVCQRPACPILDCSRDLQKQVPGSCCPECIPPEEVRSQCSHKGNVYEDGQSWKLDACGSCKCHRGMSNCAMTRCNGTMPCERGTKLVHLPGECCKKCVAVEGVCMVFGDPHYKTFDGKIYTFQGVGKYMLVTDIINQSFSIRVANEVSRSFLLTKRVAVRYGDLRLNLQQRKRVKLNKKRISLPFKMEGKLHIEEKNGNVEVILENGVKLFWDGKSFLEVTMPATFRKKLSGLCGNFNGDIQDDLTSRKKEILTDYQIWQFGSSWCVGSKATCANASRSSKQFLKHRPSSCHRVDKSQKNRCKFLNNSTIFGECDSKLNYQKYYNSCKSDMCKCPNGKCYCDSLMAYARECEKLGVLVPGNWKEKSLCQEGDNKKKRITKKPAFLNLDIERLRRQKSFNKTRPPILIH